MARGDDLVVVSVFVNPTQFGPNEDFTRYPRNLEGDSRLLTEEGVDVLFAPTVEEMYPPNDATIVDVAGPLTAGLCGRSRPGHFRGVATVVAKLFGIVRPTRAYFGQKDAQQLAVIRRMTADLHLPVEVVACPTVREPDGLAMSSRNAYLSPDERTQALSLCAALDRAQERYAEGLRDTEALRQELSAHFRTYPLARVDYIELVDRETFEPVAELSDRTLLALAVYIGKTRLIDNALLTGG